MTSLFGAQSAAEAYEQQLVRVVFLPFAQHLVEQLSPRPGDDVLDLACGTGAVTRVLADTGAAVVGLDLTAAMVEVAKTLVPRAELRIGDMTTLPFEDSAFDVVVCQQGLQFVPDRAAAAREMRRVLRADGRVAISCWVAVARSALFNGIAQAVREFGWDDLVTAYATPFSLPGDELAELLTEAGFSDVALEEVELVLPVPDARAVIEQYASVPPFASRFLAASDAERERFLDTATASLPPAGGLPFVTSICTAHC